jgi:CRISPR/Cas system CSM-associated protein Csm3 (group 7 of RAMP superfamily)
MRNRQITIPLVTRTGLHVGSGKGNDVSDSLVRRDASGAPVIPGTGLAGALRTLATRLAPRLDLSDARRCKALRQDSDNEPCGCIVCQLFGDVNPGDGEQEQATAARLWVHDAYLIGRSPSSVRDGVGIDRATGAAYRQGKIKFDTEVLSPGTKFELRLELDAPDAETNVDTQEQLLAALLAEWRSGRGALGGRVSRGLGAVEVQPDRPHPIVYRSFDFDDAGDLYAYLAHDDPWRYATIDPGWYDRRIAEVQALTKPALQDAAAGVARTWVELTAEIEALGPLLVNDPVTAALSGLDHAPLLVAGDRERPLLPGSSIKGVLRSQAERIVATLTTRRVWQEQPVGQRRDAFLHACPICNPLVGEAALPQASCDALLKKEVPSTQEVEDAHLCLGCRLFGSTRRGSRLRVEDAPLVGRPVYKPQDFLAIDRFTGGGAEHLKFDAGLLWKPRFAVRLYLENPEPWELGWLLLTLRDLHEGLATLGFGGAKGFGKVRAREWVVKVGYVDTVDAAELHLEGAPEGEQEGLYHTTRCTSEGASTWSESATAWVQAFEEQVEKFERDALPPLKADTYFGTGIEELYPAIVPEKTVEEQHG